MKRRHLSRMPVPEDGYLIDSQDSEHWYRGSLAASYLAPLLGFSVVALTVDTDAVSLPAVLVGLMGLGTPPLLHLAQGNRSGAGYSLLGMMSATGVGALTGAAVGHLAPGAASRKDAKKHNAAAFGVLGYMAWALIDVAFFAAREPQEPSVTVALVPHAAGAGSLPGGAELRIAGAL